MLKNQNVATSVLEMLNTAVEAAEQLILFLNKENFVATGTLSADLQMLLESIQKIADDIHKEEEAIALPASIKSILASLNRIYCFMEEDVEKAKHKIEYELIPLIEELIGKFYFWGCVFPDEKKIQHYKECEQKKLFKNRYIEKIKKTGEYRYELTIYIVAYNKLEYTQMCVASLLENLPVGISYELILVNHGSTDGTKEYFESIRPNKQLDIAVNGGGIGALTRIVEGKYLLQVSNDVLVTKNAINNLYDCISQDATIGWVVPSTPNVSNLQTIPLEYSNISEMYKLSESNNKRDLYRREQRVRLCNPIDVKRFSLMFEIGIPGNFHSKKAYSFSDDKMAALYRRNGYKMMLVKDAYCYHFGSITLRDELNDPYRFYSDGRKEFEQVFGIDPWDYSLCYDMNLFTTLMLDKNENVTILGINCGMGSNSLKIKEGLKEQKHNLQVKLCNYTDEECYFEDLKGISDIVEVKSLSDLLNDNMTDKYDYIILERHLDDAEEYKEIVKTLRFSLKENGILLIRLEEGKRLNWCSKFLGDTQRIRCSDFEQSKMSWLLYENKR